MAPRTALPTLHQLVSPYAVTVRATRTGFVALGLAVALVQLACGSGSVRDEEPTGRSVLPVIDDLEEDQILARLLRPHLMRLSAGEAGRGTLITVHGINGGPDFLHPYHQTAAERGDEVYTFLYHDATERLTTSSRDLSDALIVWRDDHPRTALTLVGASAGARVVLGALVELQRARQLRGPIAVELLAPVLAGSAWGTLAIPLPDLLDGVLYVGPGKDTAPVSEFQDRLEALDFPRDIPFTIYTGDADADGDATDPRFARVAARLHAQVVVIPGATHATIIERAARERVAPPSRGVADTPP